MRVVEFYPRSGEDRNHELEERMYRIWVSGSDKDIDLQAEEVLAAQLGKSLDNRYTLFRGVELPGVDVIIPFVLVGPTGVQVFNASGLTGIYRARQEIWEAVSDDGQRFTTIRPNLIARTILIAQLLEDYLANEGLLVISAEPVLYFFQAGIDVGRDESAVRIIIPEDLEQFINELIRTPEILNTEQINRVLDVLLKSSPAYNGIALNEPSTKTDHKLVGIGKLRLRFWQWIVLGLMLIVQILLVIGFIFIIRMTT
ncbi:MAG: hypothetical protein ACNA8H_00600 [Anaerolineales bacterium]